MLLAWVAADPLYRTPPQAGGHTCVSLCCQGFCVSLHMMVASPPLASSLSGSWGRPGNCLIPESPDWAPPLVPRLLSGANVPLRKKKERTKSLLDSQAPTLKHHLQGPEVTWSFPPIQDKQLDLRDK